jgi:hypothetical protein
MLPNQSVDPDDNESDPGLLRANLNTNKDTQKQVPNIAR